MITLSSSKRLIAAASLAAILTSAVTVAPASASTSTATFAVTATVLSSCAVTATPLAFGTYSTTASTATTGSTTLLVTCTLGTPYNVALNPGTASGATVTTRKMTSGSNTLSYSLYQDAGHTTNWGQTIGSDTETGTGSAVAQTFTVYGSIPALQSVASGAYTDTITVTLTY